MCDRGPHNLKSPHLVASKSREMEMKTWRVLEFLILLICFNSDHCINIDSLHSILKGKYGLLCSVWSGFQLRV